VTHSSGFPLARPVPLSGSATSDLRLGVVGFAGPSSSRLDVT
jgi:hypothetical protein